MTHQILAVDAYAAAQRYRETQDDQYADRLLNTLSMALEWRSPPSVVEDIVGLIQIELFGLHPDRAATARQRFLDAYEDTYYAN